MFATDLEKPNILECLFPPPSPSPSVGWRWGWQWHVCYPQIRHATLKYAPTLCYIDRLLTWWKWTLRSWQFRWVESRERSERREWRTSKLPSPHSSRGLFLSLAPTKFGNPAGWHLACEQAPAEHETLDHTRLASLASFFFPLVTQSEACSHARWHQEHTEEINKRDFGITIQGAPRVSREERTKTPTTQLSTVLINDFLFNSWGF